MPEATIESQRTKLLLDLEHNKDRVASAKDEIYIVQKPSKKAPLRTIRLPTEYLARRIVSDQ